MSTITKKWLSQKIAAMEAARNEIPFGLDEDDSNTLAALRIALASLEAEAVADVVAWSSPNEERTCDVRLRRHDIKPGPLYTAPPAPVSVPDGVLKSLLPDAEKSEFWFEHNGKILFEGVKFNNAVFDACRAAMLQGAESVSNRDELSDGWVACSERMPTPKQYVLVCNDVWVGMGMHNDSEHLEDDERWQDEHHEFIDLLYHPVTYWMPLPAAPQQEVK